VTVATLTLADFLLARIAEDETWAVNAGNDFLPSVEIGSTARVLAECEAKRRIVEWHRLIDGLDAEDNPVRGCCNCIASGAVPPYLIAGPCMTSRLLALPYADHPDYREEWRP
jgi:hypothetical protein